MCDVSVGLVGYCGFVFYYGCYVYCCVIEQVVFVCDDFVGEYGGGKVGDCCVLGFFVVELQFGDYVIGQFVVVIVFGVGLGIEIVVQVVCDVCVVFQVEWNVVVFVIVVEIGDVYFWLMFYEQQDFLLGLFGYGVFFSLVFGGVVL